MGVAAKTCSGTIKTKNFKGYYCTGNTSSTKATKDSQRDAECPTCDGASCIAHWFGKAKGNNTLEEMVNQCGPCEPRCLAEYEKYKDNPFKHPYLHGADKQGCMETPTEDAFVFGEILFYHPSDQEVLGEFDKVRTEEAYGAIYAQKCQDWLDQGGTPNSVQIPATQDERNVY